MAFLFGDDIFVSYSWADGAVYAAGLANELTARGFACKLDQWGSQPGTEISCAAQGGPPTQQPPDAGGQPGRYGV